MYYQLKPDDVVREGDQCYLQKNFKSVYAGVWRVVCCSIGHTVREVDYLVFRRKINKTPQGNDLNF